MLCGGVSTIGSGTTAFNLGGIAHVDVETMVSLDDVPIALYSALGVPLSQNPIDASVENGEAAIVSFAGSAS